MKKLLVFSILGLVFAQAAPVRANDGITFEEETAPAFARSNDDGTHWWHCRAQAPRLVRVFSAKGQDYRDNIQDQALADCNAHSRFQCWPLGCKEYKKN